MPLRRPAGAPHAQRRLRLQAALVPVLLITCTSADVIVGPDIPIHLTEEQYRFNHQTTGAIEFPSDDDDSSHNNEFEADCATGRFGALERWRVLFAHLASNDIDKHIRSLADAPHPLAVYMNVADTTYTEHAPCAAIRDKLDQYMQRVRDNERSVRIESERGVYILEPSSPRIVVRSSKSVPLAPLDSSDDTSASSARDTPHQVDNDDDDESERPERSLQSPGEAFAFVSALDTLASVAARDAYKELSTAMRQPYIDEFSSADNHGIADLDELQRDHMELLLQAERELLQLLSAGTFDATWSSVYALPQWEQLRQDTNAMERKALADGWTTMAKLALAQSGSATTSVNCLRRALEWFPGFVPAYLVLATLVAQSADDPSANCDVMDVMLARVDPDELRAAGAMSSVLTRHFPHCSVVIRMAGLWDSSALFRYAVSASVIVGVLHGLWIALYFCHDYVPMLGDWCSSWMASSPQSASDASASTASTSSSAAANSSRPAANRSSSGKKPKRE